MILKQCRAVSMTSEVMDRCLDRGAQMEFEARHEFAYGANRNGITKQNLMTYHDLRLLTAYNYWTRDCLLDALAAITSERTIH